MSLSKEQRAQIARDNGAKSRGPKTPAGKAQSSRNALKSGAYATTLAPFLPAHPATLCNEDRSKFNLLLHQLTSVYQPLNEPAFAIVKSIAISRWQIARLQTCITMHWNLALIDAAHLPSSLAPELVEMHAMVRASAQLFTGTAVVAHLHRQIDQLENAITRLERRLHLLHTRFPTPTVERTQPIPAQPVENTESPAPSETPNEPPVIITENIPAVIDAYKSLYPNRKIIVMPADDVANGVNTDDDMPLAPRRAA